MSIQIINLEVCRDGFVTCFLIMPIGAYDDEEAAARAYDLAALKYWGPGTLINFPVRNSGSDIAF